MDQAQEIPTKSIGNERIPFDVLKYISEEAASYHKLIPVGIVDGVLEVGMVDPENIEARDALQFISSKFDLPFKIFLISEEDFNTAMKSYEGLGGQVDKALEAFESGAEKDEEAPGVEIIKQHEAKAGTSIVEEAPVTKIVGVILQHAVGGEASDIHIEPITDRVRVRFRVDGVLYTSLFLPQNVHEAVVARIKILTNMKLDEKRKPQDGRFSAKIENRKIDFRVSTFPTYFGEKVVLRILDPEKKLIDLASLGMNDDMLDKVKRAINQPYGLILLTGPTGSGKTTSLYSMLHEIDKDKQNAVSLEDPIEYDIPGVNQSQVRPEIDYTFATGLRSILRQDPDIIMVGEIRDKETARLAIQASLTGHLVLSTIHTNNAVGVVPRLIDMGIEPYLIPPTLILVMAQRLVPQICPDARQPLPIEGSIKVMIEKELSDLPEEHKNKIVIPDNVYRAQKTASCPNGTKGRIGVFEAVEMTRELEELILKNPGEGEIYDLIRKQGFITMKEDAMLKAFAGDISFDEVNKL